MTKKTKRISKKREKKAGEDVGGHSHAGSGSLWFNQGDASSEYFLIEDKYTTKDSYSITLAVLTKVEQQAKRVGKIPVLRFGFEPSKENYAVLRYCDACHLIDDDVLSKAVTKNKSIRFTAKYLYQSYSFSKSGLFMFKLILGATLGKEGTGKMFYVFKWKDFVDNQVRFVCSGEG